MFPIEFTPELKEAMRAYKKRFGDDFPAELVADDTEGRIAKIKECLESNTPVRESEYADALLML